MRHILEHEVIETVRVHREADDAVLDLHSSWSVELALELAEKAKAHMVVGMPIDHDTMRRAKLNAVQYLVELIHTAELVEHRDRKWYCEPFAIPSTATFHKCGGPLGRCDCVSQGIERLVLAW